MTTHYLASLDKYNRIDKSQGLLTFEMNGDSPVNASLKHINFDDGIPVRFIDELSSWAYASSNLNKYRNLEFKSMHGCYWIIPDTHRCFDRSDLFDKIFNGSEFANNSQRNT